MCLAILKPAKVKVPEESLRMGWQGNSDGAGFAYIDNGKVVAVKGLMTWKEFLAAYQAAAKKFKSSPFLIHFRIKSMGDKSAENTHPFPINGGMLIHNGTIDGTGATWNSGPSDTKCFAETFGDRLTYDFAKEHKEKLEEALGHNKVAMLYGDGQYVILGEKNGTWNDDVWYSNYSYRPRPSNAPYHNTHGMLE